MRQAALTRIPNRPVKVVLRNGVRCHIGLVPDVPPAISVHETGDAAAVVRIGEWASLGISCTNLAICWGEAAAADSARVGLVPDYKLGAVDESPQTSGLFRVGVDFCAEIYGAPPEEGSVSSFRCLGSFDIG